MLSLLPVPHTVSMTEDTISIAPVYTFADAPFARPQIRAFADACDRVFSILIKHGEGGFILAHDTSMLQNGYRITVTDTGVKIAAADETGLSNAFATLLQLSEKDETGFRLPKGEISDTPDSTWRGLMIDLARKWHPVRYLYDAVDLCWLYKINRLQLHFTDDQSFTFPSDAYPKLCTENRCYTKAELKALQEYAAERGVTLVPEIDMPGHCSQFNAAYPEIFGTHGILCAEEKTFAALHTLLCEVAALFPASPYLHLGGDEAAIAKWESCEGCKTYMTGHGLDNVHALYAHYLKRVTDMVLAMGRTPVIWEGFSKEYNDQISKNVLVIAWESYYQLAPDLLASGFSLINCAWKPLYIVTPNTHWTPVEILDWNIYTWRHWWEKSIASRQDIVVPEDSPIYGGQICAWGDGLVDHPSCEDAVCTEFALIRARIPALAEKTWNVHSTLTADAWSAAYQHTDTVLNRLLRKG